MDRRSEEQQRETGANGLAATPSRAASFLFADITMLLSCASIINRLRDARIAPSPVQTARCAGPVIAH